jgi:hypothetical protein
VVSVSPVASAFLVPVVFPPEASARLALNPRGTRLAVSWEDADSVQVSDARSGREVTRCSGFQRICGIEFLSANVLLVTASDGCFRCDLRLGERDVLSSELWPGGTTVSPEGRKVALGVKRGLILYDARKGHELRHLKTDLALGAGEDAEGRRAAFSAGGRYVAGALQQPYGWPYLVVVWELQTGRRQRVFDTIGHALAFRDDTLSLAVADDWGHINFYEPDHGEEPAVQFKVEYLPRAMQFRDGGRTLAVLLDGGAFVLFEAGTGRILRRKEPPAPDGLHGAVASVDWSRFAGATEGGVVVWPGDRAPEEKGT